MIAPENKSQIIEFVKAGKTKQAIELLVKSLESDELSLEYHKAILLSNRYYKHQNDITLGLKAEAHEMNDSNHQILELLRNDESHSMLKTGDEKMGVEEIWAILLLLGVVSFGIVLFSLEEFFGEDGPFYWTILVLSFALLLTLIASTLRGK